MIWPILVSRKNDEVAFLAVLLDKAEREIETYKSLIHHLKNENRRSTDILQPSARPRFSPTICWAWKHFELGNAIGRTKTTQEMLSLAMATLGA